MKKIILTSLAIVLILSAAATTLVLAQNDGPNPQMQRMENHLCTKLRSAVADGLISSDLANRIIKYWQKTPDSELPKLYNRVMNMLMSKEQSQIQQAIFTRLLHQAVSQELLTPEKARRINASWQDMSAAEQDRLYNRIANLVGGEGKR